MVRRETRVPLICAANSVRKSGRPNWGRNELFSWPGKRQVSGKKKKQASGACASGFWWLEGRSDREGRGESRASSKRAILQTRRAKRRTKQNPESLIQQH